MISIMLPLLFTLISSFVHANHTNDYTLTRQQAQELIKIEVLNRFGLNSGYTDTQAIPNDLRHLINHATQEIINSPDNFTNFHNRYWGPSRRYSIGLVRQHTLAAVQGFIMDQTTKLVHNYKQEIRTAIKEKIQEKVLNAITKHTSLRSFIGQELKETLHETIHDSKTAILYFYERECPICSTEFFEDKHVNTNCTPAILPCGHMLCVHCITKLNEERSMLKCPICRKIATLKTLLQ